VDGQVFIQPPQGEFTDVYFVAGRVVSEDGRPVNHALIEVVVTGVRGVRVEPVTVQSDCHGDFGAVFNALGAMEGRPKVTARLQAEPDRNVTAAEETQDADTFHRRNNFVFENPGEWERGCGDVHTYWDTRVTAWGRVVEGVPGYEENGETFHARAVEGKQVNLSVTTDGRTHGPPRGSPPTVTDERGDFKYSFTFGRALDSGTLHLNVGGEWQNATIDPVTRIAFFNVNVGDDPPAVQGFLTPAASIVAALTAVAAAALLVGQRREP
jgi:hypothetical protein